jgi:hypothetical protein
MISPVRRDRERRAATACQRTQCRAGTDAPIHAVIRLIIDFAEPGTVFPRCFGKARRYPIILRNDGLDSLVFGGFFFIDLHEATIARTSLQMLRPTPECVQVKPRLNAIWLRKAGVLRYDRSAVIRSRVQRLPQVAVEIIKVAKRACQEEVLPDIAERPLDLSLGHESNRFISFVHSRLINKLNTK